MTFHERNPIKKIPVFGSKTPSLPSLPIYEHEGTRQEGTPLLSIPKLIEETHQFLDTFRIKAKENQMPNTIFFLDKSARPLAYVLRKLFPIYCPNTPLPAVRFINIGPINAPTRERTFIGPASIIEKAYGHHINKEGSMLVVNEWDQTGESTARAKKLLSEAFPQASISTQVAYTKLPAWYWNRFYSGVEEYGIADYHDMVVKAYNRETGEQLDGFYFNNPRMIEILDNVVGTIPYTKKGQRTIRTNQYWSVGIRKNLLDNLFPFRTIDMFKKTRKELDVLCKAIATKYVPT